MSIDKNNRHRGSDEGAAGAHSGGLAEGAEEMARAPGTARRPQLASKKPLPRQGLGVERLIRGSGFAGGLDATAELAAEAEGGAGAQDGQRARHIAEIVDHVVNTAVGICNDSVLNVDRAWHAGYSHIVGNSRNVEQ